MNSQIQHTPISRVGIVGAGLMGQGIASSILRAGLAVALVDSTPAQLSRAQSRISTRFPGLSDRQFQLCEVVSELPDVDLVIETVPEDMEIKRKVLRAVAQAVSSDAVIATNTSALSITSLAECVVRSQRFVGLHYFSPAEKAPTVELVLQPATSEGVRQRTKDFLEVCGKTPLPCIDRPGFAINRFFCPFMNAAAEVLAMYPEAKPSQIDEIAIELTGAKAGPFQVMNLVKAEIVVRAMQSLRDLGTPYALSARLSDQMESGEEWDLSPPRERLPSGLRNGIYNHLLASVVVPLKELLDEGVATFEDVDRAARTTLLWSRPLSNLIEETDNTSIDQPVH